MRIGRFQVPPLMLMLVFLPVAAVLEFAHADPPLVFAASALSIIPLAGLMGRATESLSERMGPGLGGLLNASFGNAAELIIALVALQRGLPEVVKASITGSIIGNILLVLGLAILAGGLRFDRLRFNATAASMGGTLLALSAIGLVVPAIFHRMVAGHANAHEKELSLEIAIVLFATYLLSLVFSLKTHKHLYAGQPGPPSAEMGRIEDAVAGGAAHGWGRNRAIVVLLVAAGTIGLVSEWLVQAVEATAAAFGMTEVFVGVILVAIVGNAAEHSTAVLVARKNQMDLAMHIAVGSSIQVALFVAPVLVFASYAFGSPLDLLFTNFEVLAVVASVAVVNLVALDGEANWLEGVQLLAVYVILGLAFFFLP
ncbi:MAG TPA: calcium/proton exchanger [Candidatus Krumholzibacteria bacterium]|nr:calcium/proton exchanger [Candidatus Krumholzibacteria bacterium]